MDNPISRWANRFLDRDRDQPHDPRERDGRDRWDEGAARREFADRYRGREGDWNERDEGSRGESSWRSQWQHTRGDTEPSPWRSADRGRDEIERSRAAQYTDLPYFGTETHVGAPRPQRGAFAGRGPKGYRRSDERIREDVCDRLTVHPDIDAHEIEVTVTDGVVVLSGSVPSRQMRHLAEDVSADLPGARDVDNKLRVERPAAREGGESWRELKPGSDH